MFVLRCSVVVLFCVLLISLVMFCSFVMKRYLYFITSLWFHVFLGLCNSIRSPAFLRCYSVSCTCLLYYLQWYLCCVSLIFLSLRLRLSIHRCCIVFPSALQIYLVFVMLCCISSWGLSICVLVSPTCMRCVIEGPLHVFNLIWCFCLWRLLL